MNLTLSPIEDVIADYGKGRLVIIVDDADRENEGDLAFAAEKVTAEMLAFMMCEGRGLICVSISGELAAHLKLPLQTLNNNSAFNTQFAVSIDHRSVLGKGVTASSRATTIFNLISGSANAEDFISPGHVFPLIANSAGVVGRQGQTEGSFDLARMA